MEIKGGEFGVLHVTFLESTAAYMMSIQPLNVAWQRNHRDRIHPKHRKKPELCQLCRGMPGTLGDPV